MPDADPHSMGGVWTKKEPSLLTTTHSPGGEPQQQAARGRRRNTEVLLLLGRKPSAWGLRPGESGSPMLLAAAVWSRVSTLLSREKGEKETVLVQISYSCLSY